MVVPIDCSSPPAPAASPSGYRGRSPASRFSAVRTLVSELSRSPRGECVGQFYARPPPPRKPFSHIPLVPPRLHRSTPRPPPQPPHFHRFSTAPCGQPGTSVVEVRGQRASKPPHRWSSSDERQRGAPVETPAAKAGRWGRLGFETVAAQPPQPTGPDHPRWSSSDERQRGAPVETPAAKAGRWGGVGFETIASATSSTNEADHDRWSSSDERQRGAPVETPAAKAGRWGGVGFETVASATSSTNEAAVGG